MFVIRKKGILALDRKLKNAWLKVNGDTERERDRERERERERESKS